MKNTVLPLLALLVYTATSAQITTYNACAFDFCKGENLENIVMKLDSTSPAGSLFTNATGCGAFNTALIAPNTTLTVHPFAELDPLNGITTFDLSFFKGFLQGLEVFTTTYQWIAADINMDHTVDSLDLVLLYQIASGISNNNAYRFFPKNFVFSHPEMPLLDSIPEGKISFMNGQPANIEFYGVQLGKVAPRNCDGVSGAFESTVNPSNVRIFPNPVREVLQIEIPQSSIASTIRLTNSGTSNRSEKLQIFGVYGNLVLDTPLASDTKEFIFNTEFWPAGIYFYRIIDGTNKNPTGQFVVTH